MLLVFVIQLLRKKRKEEKKVTPAFQADLIVAFSPFDVENAIDIKGTGALPKETWFLFKKQTIGWLFSEGKEPVWTVRTNGRYIVYKKSIFPVWTSPFDNRNFWDVRFLKCSGLDEYSFFFFLMRMHVLRGKGLTVEKYRRNGSTCLVSSCGNESGTTTKIIARSAQVSSSADCLMVRRGVRSRIYTNRKG